MAPSAIHSDPDILAGTPVCIGTRVPFHALIDYVEGGYTLEQFLDHFPSVTRGQAVAASPRSRTVRCMAPETTAKPAPACNLYIASTAFDHG